MKNRILSWPTFRKIFIIIFILSLCGCAEHWRIHDDDPYGFFSGIWHGLIFPFSLCINIISWFCSLINVSFFRSIEIIGRPNTGFFWYYPGYLIGLSWVGVFRESSDRSS